jgi:hypothetical protein
MPDDMYERDILSWSEHQAALLRRLAVGERVNEAIDWPHVIEEVEDLGRAELHACESLLRQAMLHLLKLRSGADQPAAHWRAETLGFLADAALRFTPAMRQRIDLGRLYARARHQAVTASDLPMPPLPETCPWTLDSLLADSPDLDTLLSAL